MANAAGWDRLARIRRRARGKPVTLGTTNNAQAQIAKAITFLTWLKTQGETLTTRRQPLIDIWLTCEPHQGNYGAKPFVTWAVRSKFASGISIPTRPKRTFQATLDADERWTIARQLINDDSYETRDRVAGLFLLLYGQTPARICRLTTANVIRDKDGVARRLNKTPRRLPPPLDALVLQLVTQSHQHTMVTSDQNVPWLFPTQRPGRPLTSARLNHRLRQIGLPPEPGRCATLLDLCTQMPAGLLQRLLGISASAAERWSDGEVRTGYAAEVASRS